MIVHRSRKWPLFAVAAVAMVLGAAVSRTFCDDGSASDWTAPARAVRKANPIPADDSSIAAGKAVYTKNCLSCHGAAGKGDGAAAYAMSPAPSDLSNPKIASQSDGAIFWKLAEGRKAMPAFDALTTETERWQVINYVRTLAPRPTASTEPSNQPGTGGNP